MKTLQKIVLSAAITAGSLGLSHHYACENLRLKSTLNKNFGAETLSNSILENQESKNKRNLIYSSILSILGVVSFAHYTKKGAREYVLRKYKERNL